MKKIGAILLIVGIILTMAGCVHEKVTIEDGTKDNRYVTTIIDDEKVKTEHIITTCEVVDGKLVTTEYVETTWENVDVAKWD